MGKNEDISKYIGKVYGRLTVIGEFVTSKGNKKVLCECNCPDKTIRDYFLSNLKNGNTKSCGCYYRESLSINKKTHGKRDHPIYDVWTKMRQRCKNKNHKQYKDYGGRGIYVCDEWLHDFKPFYDWCISNGWEEGLEIDRENNDGNYEPNNCRFVTSQVNCCNRRLLNMSNKSGYCGVSFYNRKWTSYVTYKNKKVRLGYYSIAQSAAFIRDKYCVENDIPLPLNFTWLNPNIWNPSGWIY